MKMPKIGIERLVDESILSNQEQPRKRIGCSQIGEECESKIWYDLNYPKLFDDARILRIFECGKVMEDQVISMLKKAGIEVHDRYDGKQIRVSFIDGELQGSVDGVIKGLPESSKYHVLEIKTYNDQRFKKLCETGVKESDPKYYAQVCLYMHGLDLDVALFIAYNKNTSEIYYERVYADPFEAEFQINKARKILSTTDVSLLDRISSNKTDYRCKFCSHNKECQIVRSKSNKKINS